MKAEGSVEIICSALVKAGELAILDEVAVVAGSGIVGDRNFAKTKYPGQNITLVEAEEVEAFNREFGVSIPLTGTRRNLVTRGVRLNDLLGKEFRVGSVRLRGMELCEPCTSLGKYLAATKLTPAQIVRDFAHRCGLSADVLDSGTIRRGDGIGTDALSYVPSSNARSRALRR